MAKRQKPKRKAKRGPSKESLHIRGDPGQALARLPKSNKRLTRTAKQEFDAAHAKAMKSFALGDCQIETLHGNSDSVTPLTEEEQRAIAYRYTELQSAIHRGSPGVGRKYDALCKVYRGKSRTFLLSFASARDKGRWTRQLELYLFAEIEPQFWPTEGH